MKDLIEALQIFLKYRDAKWPTHCEHDTLCVVSVGHDEVLPADAKRLGELGFFWSDGDDAWISYRFGSA